MLDTTSNYDCRQDGSDPPAHIRAILTTPVALRARAAIREEMARQDDAARDTLASWRNRAVASHMLLRAAEAEATGRTLG